MGRGIAVVEAALFHRLPIGNDDLVMVNRVDADRAQVGTRVDQRAQRARLA